MSNSDPLSLLEAAGSATGQAYAPYSKFRVGAAILYNGGVVFTGCNIENASYGLTICAERNAVAAAVAKGHTTIEAVAIVVEDETPAYPCGACRQVLMEFASPDTPVLRRLGRKSRRLC